MFKLYVRCSSTNTTQVISFNTRREADNAAWILMGFGGTSVAKLY